MGTTTTSRACSTRSCSAWCPKAAGPATACWAAAGGLAASDSDLINEIEGENGGAIGVRKAVAGGFRNLKKGVKSVFGAGREQGDVEALS